MALARSEEALMRKIVELAGLMIDWSKLREIREELVEDFERAREFKRRGG